MNPRGLFIFWYVLYVFLPDINMLLVGVFTLLYFILILLNNWSKHHARQKRRYPAVREGRESYA